MAEMAAMARESTPELSPLDIGQAYVPLPVYKEAGTATVDIDSLLSPALKLREDLSSGCGGQTWLAGMVLAKHIFKYHREDFESERM